MSYDQLIWIIIASWVVIGIMLVVGCWAIDHMLTLELRLTEKFHDITRGPAGWIGPQGIAGDQGPPGIGVDQSSIVAILTSLERAHRRIDALMPPPTEESSPK